MISARPRKVGRFAFRAHKQRGRPGASSCHDRHPAGLPHPQPRYARLAPSPCMERGRRGASAPSGG